MSPKSYSTRNKLNFTLDRRADFRAIVRFPQGLHDTRFRLSFQRTGGEVETKALLFQGNSRVVSGPDLSFLQRRAMPAIAWILEECYRKKSRFYQASGWRAPSQMRSNRILKRFFAGCFIFQPKPPKRRITNQSLRDRAATTPSVFVFFLNWKVNQ